jgi:hypothetical protein
MASAPEPIQSLRKALKDGLLTPEVAEAARALLLEALNATKDMYVSCPGCGKRVPVQVPDLGTRVKAVQALLDQIEGKVAAAPPQKPRASGQKFEEMSDEELEALLGVEDDLADQR